MARHPTLWLMTRRPWTAQDQLIAEAGAARGMSYLAIGELLSRSAYEIGNYLDHQLLEKHREARRRLRKSICDNRQLSIGKSERRRRARLADVDNRRKYNQQWRTLNPDKARESKRRQRARKRASHQNPLLPATLQQIKSRRALWRHRCAFCGVDANHPRNHGLKQLTIEHVLALFNQGLDEASNLMPSCKSCNSSKSVAPIEEWYRRQPFFTETRWRKICRHCPAAVVGQLPLAFSPADAEPAP